MCLKRLLLYIFLNLTLLVPAIAGAQSLMFRHLTTDHGLSQFSVNALYHDERGLIWIGTREGLNRYDGNGVTCYKLRKGDPKSLFCNTVLRITGDGQGNLFLLCTEGVARFDMRRDEFRTLITGDVSAIYYHEGLYVARGAALFRCNPEDGTLTSYLKLPTPEGSAITCLQHDTQGTLWVGTDRSGVYAIAPSGAVTHPFAQGNITNIYEDSRGGIWIGTWEEGLYHRAGGGSAWRNIHATPGGVLSDFVRCFVEDNRGDMWIGTFLGLNKLDTHSGAITAFHAEDQPGSLTHSSIWCLVKDHQGTIWAGTYFGGVNYFNPEYEIYTRYKISPTPGGGLSSPIVGKMIEDSEQNLWICTEGGGVNVLNRQTGHFRWLRHSPTQNSISHNNVKAICHDPARHAMWIGTHLGGLNRLDLGTGRFTHYRFSATDPATIPSDIVRDVVLHDDQLIVATQEGVCRFDPQTGRAERLFRDTEEGRRIKAVASLYIDRRGTLWIAATGEGLFTYRFDTRALKRYSHHAEEPNSLSSNNVNSIIEDSDSNLWIATSGTGLDRYRPASDDFENFDAANNGLSSDCIYDIRDSRSGALLVITNQGFSRFDYTTHRFDNHTLDNGFPLTAINENAICFTRDGHLFLGGTQGMVGFALAALDIPKKPYTIVASQLEVNGLPVETGDATGILDQALPYTSSIRLPSKYSVFTVEFATSNFIAANQEELLYRLDGFSREWTPTRGEHRITYTNLNPGHYTLMVRGTGNTIPEMQLRIEVLPPYYRTVVAWLLYVLTAGGFTWLLVRAYRARIRLQESLRYEKQRIRDVEELNQSKLRFFTNISHEFRTPLTLIIGQVEMLLQMQAFAPAIYNKILRIYKNSLQMRELIGELLDFRKQEQGHMQVRVAEQDLVRFLEENYQTFLDYASYRGVCLNFDKQTESVAVWFDRGQMQKVINNLLSNAFKHTPEGGEITLWVTSEAEHVRFGVRDTGSGIATTDLVRIFDRFYQGQGTESVTSPGTGIGLALTKGIIELHHGTITATSTPTKGSAFTVTLPLGRAHFADEQIAEECPLPPLRLPDPTTEHAFAFEKAEMDEAVRQRIRGARILIIEDNDALREMLAHLFEPFYEVSTASDGEEGWEKTLAEEPQIVLSDVVMPRLSGTELCRRIKNDIATSHIPVVLLTARTAVEHNIEGLRNGADDYITKPFNVTLLLSRCNNLVNSRIVMREKFGSSPAQPVRMLATTTLDQQLLDRATAIIEKYMDNPEFNVNTFAREMGMARTNLFAKLKAITGSTPNEFLSTIRLKMAAALLCDHPELSVAEISDRTGFNSPRYFSKTFKAQFSITPLAYRKRATGQEPTTDDPEEADDTEDDTPPQA